MRIIYPGSFDPFTQAHEALVRRAAKIADEVIVLFAVNSNKESFYDLETRMSFACTALADCDNIRIDHHSGLLATYFEQSGADAVLRGLRDLNDFAYEQGMAEVNRRLCPGLETIFLVAHPEYAWMSSTLARELAVQEASLEAIIPAAVIAAHQAELYRRK